MPSTLLSFITIAVYSCTLCQAPPPLNPFAGEGGVGHTFAQGPGPFYNGIGLPIEYGNLAPGHHLNNVVPRFPVEDFPEHLAPHLLKLPTIIIIIETAKTPTISGDLTILPASLRQPSAPTFSISTGSSNPQPPTLD
ncbi:hypothetical protein PGT21_021710 [Puccinia graminis f. sp. tritici]|uniref:Uncharacterized protein n=1 Tax=Puccinia graminis f. sp. tritici TaxID=56615 RepID=A0A5B0LLU3_PUCGR|nr:hypothetical protein PGT21_021710 [Puccinia graminis f. sp. tritici]